MEPTRDELLRMDDEALLRLCRCEACRGVGPGGQKRNKTSTAVRVTYEPRGLSAMDDVTRSQHLNRQNALRKLRLEMALNWREPSVDWTEEIPGVHAAAFARWAACMMDALEATAFRVSEAAALLNMSTGRLNRELLKHPALWQRMNEERVKRGLGALKA